MADFSNKNCPTNLPPELWSQVLWHHSEPDQLWTTGRRVCSFWRAEIPKIFATKYLQDPKVIRIKFPCVRDPECGPSGGCRSIEMVFDRFEESDRQRCIFAKDLCPAARATPYLVYADAKIADFHFHSPPYNVHISAIADETQLPGLHIDYENREISFRWEELFNLLFE